MFLSLTDSPEAELFEISDNGVISVASAIDSEAIRETFFLTIRVRVIYTHVSSACIVLQFLSVTFPVSLNFTSNSQFRGHAINDVKQLSLSICHESHNI